ncbi:MAG: alpha/beta hydrolase [Candidatus Eremiobacteraeota bacterium]|nr:alpha/beta hydrolase [Candidatus Eremiobacteraeota bacterium]
MFVRIVALATATIVAFALASPVPAAAKLKNIVLVHGAWADGSSWAKVIPLLQAQGYNVTAVQNPLTSLDDDVAATKRVLNLQDGPVLLVGHSWAGMVITQAGTDPKVVGLVYVDAFSPDVGQSANDLGQGFPAPPGLKAVTGPSDSFLWLSQAGVEQYFVPGLSKSDADVVWSTQGPITATSFSVKVTAAAWKAKPSWCLFGMHDQMISPDLERAMAKKIGAKSVVEVDSGHVPMLEQPQKVADFIANVAKGL